MAGSADGKQFAVRRQRDCLGVTAGFSVAPQIPLDAQTGDRPLLRRPFPCGVASVRHSGAGSCAPSPDRLIRPQSPGPAVQSCANRSDQAFAEGRVEQIRCRRGLGVVQKCQGRHCVAATLVPPAGFAGAVQFDAGPLLMCRRNRNLPRLEIRPPVPARRCRRTESRQRAPLMTGASQLKRVSRTRSGVGRRPSAGVKLSLRPRHCPPMMRSVLCFVAAFAGSGHFVASSKGGRIVAFCGRSPLPLL